MKKTTLFIIVFMVLIGFVVADSSINYLTKGYADTLYCSLFGCDMQGSINMNGNTITNVTLEGAIIVNASQSLAWDNITGIPADIADGDDDTQYTHLSNFTNDGVFITDGNTGWDNIYGLLVASNLTWENLLNIPAGFADDVDNDTQYFNLSEFNNDLVVNGSQISGFDWWTNVESINESDAYFFWNTTNSTLQLYVNGEIQQDWGASTTIYQEATFLDNAFFKDLFFEGAGGEGLFINTSVIIGQNLSVLGWMHGNGTYITDVCHTTGEGCDFNATAVFNLSNSWNDLTDVPAGFADNIDNEKAGALPFLYNDSDFIYFNETLLNLTIGQLAEVNVFEEDVSFSVVSGYGSALSTTAIDFEITRLEVYPASNSTNYRFQAVEQGTQQIIDKDRIPHKGVWDIEKSHAIDNEFVNVTISNAVTDGTYMVRITYLDNYK